MGNPVVSTAGVITQGPPIPSAGSGNPANLPFSNSQAAVSYYMSSSITLGSGTAEAPASIGYLIQGGMTFLGIWTYWAGSASVTLDCSLWAGAWSAGVSAFTKVASGSLAVSAAGWYYIAYVTPYVVTTAGLGWAATVYESTGTYFTYGTSLAFGYLAPAGAFNVYNTWTKYGAGNAVPPTAGTNITYPVEPILTWNTTSTTASYVQPAVGSSVTISISSLSGITAGCFLFITNGGVYRVQSVGASSVVAYNFGDATNSATVGATIASGSVVY